MKFRNCKATPTMEIILPSGMKIVGGLGRYQRSHGCAHRQQVPAVLRGICGA